MDQGPPGPSETADDIKDPTPWVVAYLDILGYREILKAAGGRLLDPSDGPPSPADLRRALERAIRVRRDFIRHADAFLSALLRAAAAMAPPERAELEEVRRVWSQVQLRSARFSDTVLLYTNIPSTNRATTQSLYSMFFGCALLQILQLARGVENIHDTLPLRGAIDVDVGVEVTDHEREDKAPSHRWEPQLYSAAIANVYELEQTVADVPRIVLGDQLMGLLDAFADVSRERARRRPTSRTSSANGKVSAEVRGVSAAIRLRLVFRRLARNHRE
jgi:hypothetical protein